MSLRADVATGETTLHEVDLSLPGTIPLELSRSYHSRADTSGMFGHRWRFNFDVTLEVRPDRVVYRDGSGREVFFKAVDPGLEVTHDETGLLLQHHPDAYVVYASPLLQQLFLKKYAAGTLLRLDRVEDPNGNTLQFTYRDGRLIALVDTLGRQVRFDYEGALCTALRVAGPAGDAWVPVRSYRYDRAGDLVVVTDALRRETRYAYADHLMVTHTNRLGGSRYAAYDEAGRCRALWGHDNAGIRALAYDDQRQLTRVINSDGRQSLYRHVLGRQVLQQIDPEAHLQVYNYDATFRLMGFSDAGDAIAAFQKLDPDTGELVLIDGRKRMATLQYNASGLAEAVADALGNTWSLAYDERQNLLRATLPSGVAWTFERDRQGQVTAVVSPEGRRTRFTRSRDSRTLTVKDDLGQRYTEQYDLFGRPTEREDALGRKYYWTYDAEGRLTGFKVEQGHEVRYEYDADGRLVGTTDSRQRRTRFDRNAWGALTAYTGEDGRRWQFQHDPEGRLVAAADGTGKTARFAYDWHGRLLRATGFDGQTRTYRYAPGSTVVQHDATGETVRRYSPLMELEEETRPDAAVRRYAYGPSGELLEAAWPGGKLRVTYDEDGRIASLQGAKEKVTITHDRDGLLRTVAEADGNTYALTYDRRGRVVALDAAGGAWRFTYDAGDRLATLEGPAAARYTFTYDRVDRLTRRTVDRAGDPPEVRRFHSKRADVVADVLRSTPSEDAVAPDAAQSPVLLQSLYGLVLVARFGELQVPLWSQDDLLRPRRTGHDLGVVLACLEGPDARFRARTFPSGPELHDAWERRVRQGRVLLYTEVPRTYEGGTGRVALDAFFFDRTFYDYFYPQMTPGYVPRHVDDPVRSSDRQLTGSHMVGYLKPPVWTGHAMGPHLDRSGALCTPGGLQPEDVIHLAATRT